MIAVESDNSVARRRVWLVNLFFGKGIAPTGTLLEDAAVALAARGYEITALCGDSAYNGATAKTASRFRGKIVRLWTGARASRLFRGKFVSWLIFYLSVACWTFTRRVPEQVVVMTTPPFLHWIFVIRNLVAWRKAEVILWNQDTYPDILASVGTMRAHGLSYQLLAGANRWAGRRVDQGIGLDGAMAQILQSHGLRNVQVVPNWQSETPPANAAPPLEPGLDRLLAEVKQRYRFCVLYSGNYGWGHNLEPLLKFIREHPGQTDFFFFFVGGGEKWNYLCKFKEQQQATCMSIRGYLPEMDYLFLLDRVDFGLVALKAECVGLMSPSKMHSYLRAGVPLIYIGGAGSNVAEAIETYDCGWRIGETDYQGLCDLFSYLAEAEPAHPRSRDKARAAFQQFREERGTALFVACLEHRVGELQSHLATDDSRRLIS